MTSVLLVVLAFVLMIFIHEIGHFIIAKATGLQVLEFAIGFGPKICGFKYKGTQYSLRIIPLGGYNKIPILDSDLPEKILSFKDYMKRMAVLAAGSVFNILSAGIAIMMMFYFIGTPSPVPKVGFIIPDSIAGKYLQVGDNILQIDGKDLVENEKISNEVIDHLRESKSIDMTILREGEETNLQIEKKENEPIGMMFANEYKPTTLPKAFEIAKDKTVMLTIGIYKGLAEFVTSDQMKVTESLSGPIGISQTMHQANMQMGIFGLGMMFILVSINLGIFNLLPLPLLDGGHMVIQTLQFITRNRISERVLTAINYTGLAIILGLLCLGTYSDLLRLMK